MRRARSAAGRTRDPARHRRRDRTICLPIPLCPGLTRCARKPSPKSIRPLGPSSFTNAVQHAGCSPPWARLPQRSASLRSWRSFCSTRFQGQKAIRGTRRIHFNSCIGYAGPKRRPTTPRHCFKGSSSFTEAKSRNQAASRTRLQAEARKVSSSARKIHAVAGKEVGAGHHSEAGAHGARFQNPKNWRRRLVGAMHHDTSNDVHAHWLTGLLFFTGQRPAVAVLSYGDGAAGFGATS